jgi:hypothetical protein
VEGPCQAQSSIIQTLHHPLTTILMEMGNILYQGYHILLEMTVSKVGVDTMATKQLSAS